MCAVLCAQVCKVYRFQTEDQRWLLVREQMSETPLSFSLPKQLLSALIREHTSRSVFVFVFCWEATESVFKFYWTEWLKFWQENESFCSFYCCQAQKHESRRFFHNVDAYGKKENSLWSSSSGSRKWRSLVTFHLTGTSSAMTSSITVTTWLAVIRKCSLSSTNSQVRWIKGPNHQTLAIEGESSNDELIILSLLVYVSCTFVCSVVLFQVQHQ